MGGGAGAGHAHDVRGAHSFDELCVPHYDEMLRFAKKLCVDDDARAQDVVQDSFLKAMKAWDRWTPTMEHDLLGSARAWLYRVVSNTFLKRVRDAKVLKRRLENLHDDIATLVHGSAHRHTVMPLHDRRQPGSRYLSGESVERSALFDSPLGDEVVQALGALTIDHREVVMLHYVDGLDCDAIARELGIPRNTVFTRLDRARKSLERQLARYAKKQYGIARRAPRKQAAASAEAR